MRKLSKIDVGLVILFAAIVASQTIYSNGSKSPSLPTTIRETTKELETTTAAKRALAETGSRNINQIKDARLRVALSRSIAAAKALARNNSKGREAEMVNNFNRTIKDLKALPHPTAEGDFKECDDAYERCMLLCKSGGGVCTGCVALNGLCYMAKLTIALVNENNPTVP